MTRQLSWKKSLLLTHQISGLLVNTLASDDKYPVLNRNNLTRPIQMQLSQKQKTFSQFFSSFSKSRLNKVTLIDFSLLMLRIPKMYSDKRLKSTASEDSFTSNMVNVPKHCRKLNHRLFIIFTDQCQGN